MISRIRKCYRTPFILSAKSIREIVAILESFPCDIQIAVTCSDNTWHEFGNANELLNFHNSEETQIIILSIYAYGDSDSGLREVKLAWFRGQDNSFAMLVEKIYGESEEVVAIRSKLNLILKNLRPWYWRVAEFDKFAFNTVMIYLLVVALVGLTMYGFLLIERAGMELSLVGPTLFEVISSSPFPMGIIVIMLLEIAAFCLVIALLRYAILKTKRYLFPCGVFLVGSEKKRHKDMNLHRSIFLTTILSSLVAIVVAIFSI